ncbi:hypothetical protein [Haladaptatus sp.]|uniref:hypothetical protein n=1 Tax=Haladaptatus sp. TaxID=1973141 RepID=UPI003C3AC63E
MNRALLHYASLGLVGLSFAALSIPDLAAGDSSISLWLLAISGVGMLFGSLYEVLTGGLADFESDRFTPLIVVSAILSALGTGLSLLG